MGAPKLELSFPARKTGRDSPDPSSKWADCWKGIAQDLWLRQAASGSPKTLMYVSVSPNSSVSRRASNSWMGFNPEPLL